MNELVEYTVNLSKTAAQACAVSKLKGNRHRDSLMSLIYRCGGRARLPAEALESRVCRLQCIDDGIRLFDAVSALADDLLILAAFVVLFLEDLAKLCKRLFATARGAVHFDGAFLADAHDGLQIQLAADECHAARQAASACEPFERVDGEVHVHLPACLHGPVGKFLGGGAFLPTADALCDEQAFTRSAGKGVDQVQLHVGVLCLHLLCSHLGDFEGLGQARRESQVNGRNAAFGNGGERVDELLQGQLCRRGRGTGAHAVVERLRRRALEQVVAEFLVAEEIGELQEGDSRLVDDLEGNVAA